MLKKFLKIILKPLFVFFLIFCFFSAWYFVSSLDYAKIDKKDLPFFVIQQGKLSQKQIADLTKLNDAKNIWIISDKEDYNKATELIKQSADAISYANQVGRLDLVSILLGGIAIIFGFAGIIGFLHIETVVKTKISEAIELEFKEGGRGQEIIREETRKCFKKMSSLPMDRSISEEGDEDYETYPEEDNEAYYEELFNKNKR
jgi:cell division protein YceG involved in septum cleavage